MRRANETCADNACFDFGHDFDRLPIAVYVRPAANGYCRSEFNPKGIESFSPGLPEPAKATSGSYAENLASPERVGVSPKHIARHIRLHVAATFHDIHLETSSYDDVPPDFRCNLSPRICEKLTEKIP
jgi:hypothetical protein